jgi:hypothetical protein
MRRRGRTQVRVGFVATGAPRVDELVAGLRAAGERQVAIASWLLAPRVFHTRLADAGADVVAAPLGAPRPSSPRSWPGTAPRRPAT